MSYDQAKADYAMGMHQFAASYLAFHFNATFHRELIRIPPRPRHRTLPVVRTKWEATVREMWYKAWRLARVLRQT